MSKIITRVTARDSGGAWVTAEADRCGSCPGCGVSAARRIYLPNAPETGHRLSLQLEHAVHRKALVNSLVLPIVGFVTGASLTAWAGFADLPVIFGALAGFYAGFCLSRPVGQDELCIQTEEDFA